VNEVSRNSGTKLTADVLNRGFFAAACRQAQDDGQFLSMFFYQPPIDFIETA
jgi:hypothetical protein